MNLGDKRIAIALNDFYIDDERLVVQGTAQQVAALPAWRTGPGYSAVADDQNLELRTAP
jgi:hypothetical protein